MFVDSHCHIFNEYYEDIEQVINDSLNVGVGKLINNASNLETCKEVIELAKKYSSMYFALGIHPESVGDDFNELSQLVKDNIGNKKFIAIGEIGLDYHYGKENREQQIELFKQQLALAQEYNLPVIIHSRDATQDTLDIIKQHQVKGVLHCFNGSLEIAREYMKLGFYFGVNGVITFKNANLKEVVKDIPLEYIILETDAPYLTPEPFRKYKNEPKFIPEIARFLAELYEIPVEDIEKKTRENITNLFDI